MAEYIFYYKFQNEIFGVIEDLGEEYKVESINSRKTYDIKKNWLQSQHKKKLLDLSKTGIYFDFTEENIKSST